MAPPPMNEDGIDDLLYYARMNDMKAVKASLEAIQQSSGLGTDDIVCAAIDPESGNSVLHMAAANGHTDLLNFILSHLQPTQLAAVANGGGSHGQLGARGLVDRTNSRGNTALHWAAMNGHTQAVQSLVAAGADASLKNGAGRDAAVEAETAGKDEVANFLLGVIPAEGRVEEFDTAEHGEATVDGTAGGKP